MKDTFSIQTKSCNIRCINLSDDKDFLSAMDCPDTASMYGGGFADLSAVHSYFDVLQNEYKAGKFRTLAISGVQSDTLIGSITIDVKRYFPCAELSYWIVKPYRNKGFMTEVVSAVVKYGFSDLGLVRIQAYHSVENPASGRVLEKAGMTYEGTLRLYNGRNDEKMYSIINTDKLPD